jgi:hypothetical protein
MVKVSVKGYCGEQEEVQLGVVVGLAFEKI